MSVSIDAIVSFLSLALLLAAVAYYFYGRITYLEKKTALIENIALDLKMQAAFQPPPNLYHPPENPLEGASFHEPEPVPTGDIEVLPEVGLSQPEASYAPVEEAADASQEEALRSLLTGIPTPVAPLASDSANPNYDAMTKQELQSLLRQRSLKAPKTAKVGELISILKRDDELKGAAQKEEPVPTAAESGIAGADLEIESESIPVDE